MKERKFKWYSWNFDDEGDAYIVAKSECPDKKALPEWLTNADNLPASYAKGISENITEGWCKFQVRSDWVDMDGPHGWYIVETYEPATKNIYGKRNPGWFPVWIVRKGEWY